jgi:hypothetical protein
MFSPSPERLQQLASGLDIENEDVQKALLRILEDKATPRLEEIRMKAEASEDPETVRDRIESLPESEKDRLFHDTWAEIIASLVQLRVEPMEGMTNLKKMIRDPFTVESMLLLFEVDEMDDEIVQANKDLAAEYLNWMGCAVAPEMYSRDEVVEFIETFGADPELMDKWEQADFDVAE